MPGAASINRMRGPTRRRLALPDIAAPVPDGLHARITGGGFATVWRAGLAGGRQASVRVDRRRGSAAADPSGT